MLSALNSTADRTYRGRDKRRGGASFRNDHSTDSERLRILISMSIWAIWKSRNEKSINDQDVALSEAREVLKLKDLVRKSGNATRFMEGRMRMEQQGALRALCADRRFADFDSATGPTVDCS